MTNPEGTQFMTEERVRDFLTTIKVSNTDQSLADYLHTYQTDPTPLLIFEAPSPLSAAVDQARLQAERDLGIKTLLTVNRPTAKKPEKLADVEHIIVVASGKGGVGKSTTALNLAVALGSMGYAVGLLDADIYGPSLPKLTGIYEKPAVTQDKKLIPPEKDGIQLMSMGFIVPEESPVIWRGPMIQGALQQLLKGVAWRNRTILVVDMPPGTGDAHLTLIQQVPVSGAVIVSTPQDLALIDARKGMAMYEKVAVPILGIVENMSVFTCPQCGHDTPIFSHGGAQAEAVKRAVPFLGHIPLRMDIREQSDKGQSLFAPQSDPVIQNLYQSIAQKIAQSLGIIP